MAVGIGGGEGCGVAPVVRGGVATGRSGWRRRGLGASAPSSFFNGIEGFWPTMRCKYLHKL